MVMKLTDDEVRAAVRMWVRDKMNFSFNDCHDVRVNIVRRGLFLCEAVVVPKTRIVEKKAA